AFDLDVQLTRRAVVVAAGHLDFAFERFQRALQLPEILVRLEIRIGLRHGKEPAERPTEQAFHLATAGNVVARQALCARAERGHLLEHRAFVLHISLHRLDQVGDEVRAAFQLHVDPRPGFAHDLPRPYEAVIDDDCIAGDDQEKYKEDRAETKIHDFSLRRLSRPVVSRLQAGNGRGETLLGYYTGGIRES